WSTTHPRRWIKQPIRAKFSLVLAAFAKSVDRFKRIGQWKS
ncbi:hypothetical protein AVDCRST_MAG84-629, partial [uncultured Microcoleus sp.]